MGSGWAFPITFSGGNHELTITKYERNIEESIVIVLQTKKGARPLQPQFGSGLERFFFRTMDQTLKSEIQDTVHDTLLENEPRITVHEVEARFADPQSGRVDIHITYTFNQTNTRHNFVFPFHLIEGTNL